MYRIGSICCLQVCDAEELKRAKKSIEKAGNFQPREQRFIKRCFLRACSAMRSAHSCVSPRNVVERLVRLGQKSLELERFSMLFLLTYTFLLRLPSEALPCRAHAGGSCVEVQTDKLLIKLARRKNCPRGSVMQRGCWCSTAPLLCPVHCLGRWIKGRTAGEKLFSGITASKALSALRDMLSSLEVVGAGEYRTHDLRRGHAQDLAESGNIDMEGVLSLCVCCHEKAPRCGKSWRPGNGEAQPF